MRLVGPEKLSEIQSHPAQIRNICILAHVDHGKTTLADSLVASNGIISKKLAGKLRYLDSRPDEQQRGITMKSSSIVLYHEYDHREFAVNLIDSPGHVDFASEVSTAVRLCDGALIVVDVVEGVCPQTRGALSISYTEGLKPILVLNKIDRLITEMKLSPLDAYVHLTQVLEQVNAVMGELFASDVMEREEREEKEARKPESTESVSERNFADWRSALEDIDDSGLYFSPEQGNVLFSSATDGWGFGVREFAKIFSKKLGFSEKVLQKTLWGNFYVNAKSKRILNGAQEKARKPLFVQLILDNLWTLYDTITVRKDKEKVASMAEKLDIELTGRDLRYTDSKAQLRAVCSQWLPLARACLDAVCDKVPAPHQLTAEKIERLMSGHSDFSTLPSETQRLKEAFLACDSSPDAPIVVFVSKMFPVEKTSLPENKSRPLTPSELARRKEVARSRHAEKITAERSEERGASGSRESLEVETSKTPKTTKATNAAKATEEDTAEAAAGPAEEVEDGMSETALIAFARSYSGTIRTGSRVYVLGPKHNPGDALEREKVENWPLDDGESATLKDLRPGRYVTRVTVERLYLMMGRELEPTEEVPAGNVFGIGGLEEHILKTATLSTTLACPAFSDLASLGVPIVRVALEPKHPNDLQRLVDGLKLLNQADSCAVVHIQETGEIVLNTAGEVHLERCLEDLKLRYAKVDVNVSEPIVPFRETVVPPPKVDMVNETMEKKAPEDLNLATWTTNRQSYFELDAQPLPESITKILERNSELIKALDRHCDALSSVERKEVAATGRETGERGYEKTIEGTDETESERFSSERSGLVSEKERKALEALTNELEAAFREQGQENALEKIWSFGPRKCGPNILLNETDYKHRKFWEKRFKSTDPRSAYESGIINGFQLATLAGPLCEEPMMGVCFVVKKWEVYEDSQREPRPEYRALSRLERKRRATFANSSRRYVNSEGGKQSQGHVGGHLMSACKEACRRAFNSRRPRLVTPMYSCSVLVNSDVLGKLYAVFGKRQGRVIAADSALGFGGQFRVLATLPVPESFQLARELRTQTSGLATPQLVFSHWEVIEQDPYWVPSTDEEYLHFGDKADSENRAKRYIDAVRRRKGLPVDSQLVAHAEKQRTLSKNK